MSELNNTRLYVVTNSSTGEKRLVRARSQAQAVSHVAAGLLSAAIPSTTDVADLLTDGTGRKVEVAGE